MNIVILIFAFVTLNLLSPNLAMKDPDSILQEKISNEYYYNSGMYESCQFQTDCAFNGVTSQSYSEYLQESLPDTVFMFLESVLAPLGASISFSNFSFNITNQTNNLASTLPSQQMSNLQAYLYGQAMMFLPIGQYLEKLLTSYDPDFTLIQQARSFATCPIGIFLTNFQSEQPQDYTEYLENYEGSSGCGMGIGAQFIIYDRYQVGANRFQTIASFGGGAGGGITQSYDLLTTWGSGGGAGIQLNTNYMGLASDATFTSRGGGLGFGYNSQLCPQPQSDKSSNEDIVMFANNIKQFLSNNELQNEGKSIFIVGGGGAGGGIGQSGKYDFSFGFKFYIGASDIYNEYLASSNDGESDTQNQIIKCTSQNSLYTWSQISECVCNGPQNTNSQYINCTG